MRKKEKEVSIDGKEHLSTGGRHGIFTSLFGEGIINPPRIYVYHAATVSLLSVRAFVSHAGIWAPRSISLRLHAPERVRVLETAMSYVAIEISAGVQIYIRISRDQVAEMRSESDSHLWETRSSLVSETTARVNRIYRLDWDEYGYFVALPTLLVLLLPSHSYSTILLSLIKINIRYQK